jgi:hypothetical protein
MFLRIIVLSVLAVFACTTLPVHAKCVVAKEKFISVVLLDKSEGKPGMLTRESVSVYMNEKPSLSFRIASQKGMPWRIPTECKADMEKVLSAEEITRVARATEGK